MRRANDHAVVGPRDQNGVERRYEDLLHPRRTKDRGSEKAGRVERLQWYPSNYAGEKESVKPYYEQDGIVIYHGDCREVLPSLAHKFDAVITDPVWPNASADLVGKDEPQKLLKEALKLLSNRTRRIVLQLGFDTDPRFLQAVPKRFPFIRACWLDCARPHYKGFLLAGVDVAYVFGEIPKRDGWTVLPGMMRSTDSNGKETNHPCPRKLQHVRWLARYYAQGLVCDPFVGSGTTLAACKLLNIPAIGIEVEERFCEMAAGRLCQQVMQFEATA